jgi:antitoxin component YwqK of YwqJK toxin-antitoxin module
MKNSNLILVFLFVLYACSNERKVKEYYPNGKLRLEYTTNDGKKNGVAIEYYPSGEKWYEEEYKMGVIDGIYRVYHKNQKLKIDGHTTNGQACGFYCFYNESGKKDSLIEYILLDPDSVFDSFFNRTRLNNRKIACLNRFVCFDQHEKPIREKSRYFKTKFYKDTIKLGDTIFAKLWLINPTNNDSNNKVIAHVSIDNKKICRIYPSKANEIMYYETVAKKRGANYFEGFIEEIVRKSNDTNYVFFREKYYVR